MRAQNDVNLRCVVCQRGAPSQMKRLITSSRAMSVCTSGMTCKMRKNTPLFFIGIFTNMLSTKASQLPSSSSATTLQTEQNDGQLEHLRRAAAASSTFVCEPLLHMDTYKLPMCQSY